MEKLKGFWKLETVWHRFAINETVVQVSMELGYDYEDVSGKGETDRKDFTSASSAAVPFDQFEEEEESPGEEFVYTFSKNVWKRANKDEPHDGLNPALTCLHKQQGNDIKAMFKKKQNCSKFSL